MLKTKSKILLVIFLMVIFLTSYCLATVEPRVDDASDTQNDIATISEGGEEITTTDQATQEDATSDWTNSDLYVAKDTVTISNVVDGNAFIVADEVIVTGEIAGDLFVIANKLIIENGYVYSNIFACAKEITINGVVYDVYACANTINIGKNGYIYRNLNAMASNVKIEGTVRRDAYVSTDNIQFGEAEQAYIGGNLHYTNQTELQIPETAVGGEVKYTAANVNTNNTIGNIILSYIEDLLETIFFTLVVLLAFLWLTPKFIERVGTMELSKTLASLGVGFVAPITFVIAVILLAFSTVGTSLVICGTLIAIILAYVAFSVVSIFFGKLFAKLLKAEGTIKFVLFTLLASVILWAISQIPIIGGIFSFVVYIFGIGITLINIVWRKEEKIEK